MIAQDVSNVGEFKRLLESTGDSRSNHSANGGQLALLRRCQEHNNRIRIRVCVSLQLVINIFISSHRKGGRNNFFMVCKTENYQKSFGETLLLVEFLPRRTEPDCGG